MNKTTEEATDRVFDRISSKTFEKGAGQLKHNNFFVLNLILTTFLPVIPRNTSVRPKDSDIPIQIVLHSIRNVNFSHKSLDSHVLLKHPSNFLKQDCRFSLWCTS